MRIDRLFLKEFRNLIEFEVDFDQTSTRQVIVGRNGVGKSNLLEALTRIFRDLDLEEESEFGYEIEYLCNHYYIKIECLQDNVNDCSANPNLPKRFKRQYWTVLETACASLKCYSADNRLKRRKSERFKRYSHADIFRSDKANLDLVWLGDNSYSDSDTLPAHDLLAAEVVTLLKEAVSEFEAAVAVVKET
jgi:predicted ATP-binding protein involved in virulence